MSSDHPGEPEPARTERVPAADQSSQSPEAGELGAPHATDGAGGPGRRGGLRGAWPWLRWPVYGLAVVLVLVLGAGAWLWTSTDLPATPSVAASAVLVDRNGEELAVLAQEGLRLEVPLDEVAPVVVDALVAAEDRRFYDHTGIDPTGIVRALWNNVTAESTQGGSTLTQQLVKNTYLSTDRTLTRKVREAVLAIKLERTEDKDVILERYLNTVYFGRGAYGIEAAARTYFDSTASELAPEQAALLTGLLRAPEAFGPDDNPEAARERRDAVLAAMAEMGTLDTDEAERARAASVETVPSEPTPTILRAGVAPHFVEQVRAALIEQFGEQALYDRGFVVHTTLDIADQQAAEASVATHLTDPGGPQAAVVGIDRSGAVRAWVGGRDFEALQVDLVSASGSSGRQPGSTFKPITLAANLAAGNGAGQRFPAPAEISLDVGADEPWEVSNAGDRGYGTLTLAEATVNSVNTVYAQAVMQVGAPAVVDMAGRLGVRRALEPHPSIALGAQEVSVLEMGTVYSTLGRSGVRIDPYLMTKIEDRNGKVVWEHEVDEEQVVEPGVANTVNAVLEETPRRGTARRAALDRPMAAKTGTTQNSADAWLAGYTPEYTTIVWVGNPSGNETVEVDGREVQGGSIPALIWHDFMVKALADVEPTAFAEPDPELLGSQRSEAAEEVSDDIERDDRVTATTRRSAAPPTTSSSTTVVEDANAGDAEGEGGAVVEDPDQTEDVSGAPTTTESPTTTAAPATTAPPTTTAPAPTTTVGTAEGGG